MKSINTKNFIRNIIDEDIKNNKIRKVITRFPPEPNGYIHIGHVKSIYLNFGIAEDYKNGSCYLRFDDTNPENEKEEFIQAIKEDIQWLGFKWNKNISFASDYFEIFYNKAIDLIKSKNAYVCDLSPEEVKHYRGTLKRKGIPSPYRDRSVDENIKIFKKMRDGHFKEETSTLRAKIDMSSGNINMRDPALYRIKMTPHPRTKKTWCIYPMYDFAHAISDSIEKISHSLCTLEFQDHRTLYNWIIQKCNLTHIPKQIEFSKLNLNCAITSKRKLKYVVESKIVSGWDDPRLPTIRGLRRRGVPPYAIIDLCKKVGISKQDSITDYAIFEECIRKELNIKTVRRNIILKPLLVKIKNLEEDIINTPNHPKNPLLGRRDVNISNEIYIEKDDFIEKLNPELGLKKLSLFGRARLLNGYVIECYNILRNKKGEILFLECNFLPETLGGNRPSKGDNTRTILHWVDKKKCVDAEVRIYKNLFKNDQNTENLLNEESLNIINDAKAEISLNNSKPGEKFQFNRIGYFCADLHDHKRNHIVFNKIVDLKNNWSKNHSEDKKLFKVSDREG